MGRGTAERARQTTGRCPVCGKPSAPEHRPFCGKRCADVDLGRWLKGGYAVPGEPVSEAGPDEQDD